MKTTFISRDPYKQNGTWFKLPEYTYTHIHSTLTLAEYNQSKSSSILVVLAALRTYYARTVTDLMVGSTPDLTAEAMASRVVKELLSPAAIVPKTQYPPYASSKCGLS